MPRKLGAHCYDSRDYTTLENDLIRDAAALSPTDLEQLSRPGAVAMYDTLEDFIWPRHSSTSTPGDSHRRQPRHLWPDRPYRATAARCAVGQ